MTDGDLVRQTLGGRRAAYEELVRRHAPSVLAVCHARVGATDPAEELAQETLVRGFGCLASLADPEKFAAWLRGIALRTCLDWLKSRKRRMASLDALGNGDGAAEVLADRSPGPEQAVGDGDQLDKLVREVHALPDDYREVVLLYYYQDVTYRELAATLGVSAATINARLTKARAMLRERMSETRS